jgi:hypothetical protein
MGKDGSGWKPGAEVMNERFIRNSMEAVTPDARVVILCGNGESRRYLRDCPMKCIVKTGEVDGGGKDGLRRLNQ